MKQILLFTCLVLSAEITHGAAAKIIHATVAVTNTAGTANGETISVNGNSRTWTNSVQVSSSIQTTNSVTLAASNLFRSYVMFGESGVQTSQGATSNVVFHSTSDLTVAISSGWGLLTYSTNYITNAMVLRTPMAVMGATEQTNAASGVVELVSATMATNIPRWRGFMVQSNSQSFWPAAPSNRGDIFIANSNGYPLILLSTNGLIGSPTWTATNKLGW